MLPATRGGGYWTLALGQFLARCGLRDSAERENSRSGFRESFLRPAIATPRNFKRIAAATRDCHPTPG
jgi:hypothetical protein